MRVSIPTLIALLLAAILTGSAGAQSAKPSGGENKEKSGAPQPSLTGLAQLAGAAAGGPTGHQTKSPGDLRRLPGTRAARGAEPPTFIAPNETWSAVLAPGYDVREMENGQVLVLTPTGVPVEASTRVLTVLTVQLTPEEMRHPDTTLVQAVTAAVGQQFAQNFGLTLTPKGPATETKFGVRSGASVQYSAPLPQFNTTLELWGGLVREGTYAMVAGTITRGNELAAAQKDVQQILETVKQYQAPRSEPLEQALMGRWSGILSAKTSSTSSRSSTVTFQFNQDGSFWRRISNSYSSSGGVGTLSGASDNFDRGTFQVLGRHLVVKLQNGGELRVRLEGQVVGGQLHKVKIGGTEVVRGEI